MEHELSDAERLFASRNYNAAVIALERFLKTNIPNARVLELLAYSHANLGNMPVAKKYLEAVSQYPECKTEAIYYLGKINQQLGDHNQAISDLRLALSRAGDFFEALFDLGVSYASVANYEASLEAFIRATTLRTNSPELFFNLGRTYEALQDYQKAITNYRHAIRLRADYAEAWMSLAVVQVRVEEFEPALVSFDKAVLLKPDYARAWFNRGVLLSKLRKEAEACVSLKRAYEIDEQIEFGLDSLIHSKLKICDWSNFHDLRNKLLSSIKSGQVKAQPLILLSLFDEPQIHREAAQNFGATIPRPSIPPVFSSNLVSRDTRIRVGYFSPDFREHAVWHVFKDIVGAHDRNRFEIIGFYFGPSTSDEAHTFSKTSFDRFFDVRLLSDREISKVARECALDIAIDLAGYTGDSRPGIFASRAAPIQIGYLGYPSTAGQEFFDYIISDKSIINKVDEQYYSEKVLRLITLMPIQRYLAEDVLLLKSHYRNLYQLPQNGLVFAALHSNHKILPEIFNAWMSVLRRVNNSILWLRYENSAASDNLRAAANDVGIDANRLVFAGRSKTIGEYLERYVAADLFLDTYPYGAHSTARDALMTGLPVVAYRGKSFASRVAASMLSSLGLDQLVAGDLVEYQSKVYQFCTDTEFRKNVELTLKKSLLSKELYTADKCARDLESLYSQIVVKNSIRG